MDNVSALVVGPWKGGGPAEHSPALAIGSIFYDNNSLVHDPFTGDFDEERAARHVQRVTDLSTRYAVPGAVDIIAASPEAMVRYLEFVASHTPLPLMVNGTEAEVRIAGLEKAAALGILDRLIFASLMEDTDPAEIAALKRHRPAAIMVLVANVADPTPEGAATMLREQFLPILEEIGVPVPIVDVGAMDPPSIGVACRMIRRVRGEFGYPAGCAFSNAIYTWPGLREEGKAAVELALAVSLTYCRSAGAEFLHYGPIEKASVAFRAAAISEVFLGYAGVVCDGAELESPHPIETMFRGRR